MRNAALVLGIIGGIWAMIVGFFGYGYVTWVAEYGESGVMGTRPIRSVPFEIKMQISAPDAIDTVVNHVGIQGVEM